MAFGQINPARLEGEALRRWYQRSPGEIEEERRRANDYAYDAFFFPKRDQRPDAVAQDASQAGGESADDALVWNQVGEGRWRAARARQDPLEAAGGHPASGPVRQLAQRRPPTDFWDDWTPCNTLGCHGRPARPASPPDGGRSPLPPTYLPWSGDGAGGSGDSAGSRGEWSDRPQCNQQFEADRAVCQTAKHHKCWENQNKRLSHCSLTGHVGIPSLEFGGR